MVAWAANKPAPDYIALMVGMCADSSCSSISSTQMVESGGLVDHLDLSVANRRTAVTSTTTTAGGGAGPAEVWMLSYAGNCRNATAAGAPKAVPHPCVKVSIFGGGDF